MKTKKVLLNEIISQLGDEFINSYGDINLDFYIDNITDAEHTTYSTLDWVNSNKANKQTIAESSVAKVVLVDQEVKYSDLLKDKEKILLVVRNPRTAIAIIGNTFFCEKAVVGIHETAIIKAGAHIGKNVSIGPYSIIDKAIIGDNCVIGAHVHIFDDCKVGNDCVISDNALIGDAGFGFVKDENDNWVRFPQIGGVVIGNHVEIGSFTSIDRGALSDTIIGDYSKIDSHCKIAHNNVIGNNVVITGCCSIAGSNVIEDNVWIGPNSSLKDWGHIGKDSFIGMGSVVVTKVKPNARIFGNPAKRVTMG